MILLMILISQLQILPVRSQEEIQIPPIQKKMLLQNPRTAMMIQISLTTSPMTLVDSDGNTIEINYTFFTKIILVNIVEMME